MLKEFRDFIMRGNVLDLAVGVIIGAAFGKIVTSLVDDIIMPPIGVLVGGIDFSGLYINLSGTAYESLAAARQAKAAVIAYGAFINVVIQFLIVAFAIFVLIKAVNKVTRRTPAAAPAPTATETLLTEIRDVLKSK
ncbi:MAG: large conductance mechanosensitive channel protein MscL [Zavarzinia sp.]